MYSRVNPEKLAKDLKAAINSGDYLTLIDTAAKVAELLDTLLTYVDVEWADEDLPVGALLYDSNGDYWERKWDGWVLYQRLDGCSLDDAATPLIICTLN